jgi:hypothetical protein
LKKGLRGRLAEAAIGTGNQNDSQAHAGIVAVGAPAGKCELLEPPNRKNIQHSIPQCGTQHPITPFLDYSMLNVPWFRMESDTGTGAQSPTLESCAQPFQSSPVYPALRLAGRKATLKRPHSRRHRDCRTSPSLAKRLDCARFTAAFIRNRECLWVAHSAAQIL